MIRIQGTSLQYIPIAPAEIDRIEIVKGASSAIYGSEAVGGVIHIITKSFAAKIKIIKKNFHYRQQAVNMVCGD